jgi:hypothetical protein
MALKMALKVALKMALKIVNQTTIHCMVHRKNFEPYDESSYG